MVSLCVAFLAGRIYPPCDGLQSRRDQFRMCAMDEPITCSEQSNARILRGECLCRTVAYEVADAFEYALNCHCSNCRRATGSAFKPFAGIARDRLQLVRGDHDLLIHGEVSPRSPHEVHC